MTNKEIKLKKQVSKLKKELRQYKKAYEEFSYYFDSISDDEQPKLARKLERIFK